MVRIIHASDTHLGKGKNDERKSDYFESFEEAINIAIDEEADAFLHSGDLFDTPDPNINVILKCVKQISKLSENDIPFLAIVGNHERKRDAQWLELFEKLEYVKMLSTDPYELDDGSVKVYGVNAVRKNLWDNMEIWLDDCEDETFNILAMHELINPPAPEKFSDYTLEETLHKIKSNVDALALGDYHGSVETEKNGVQVWYPGSTERTSVKETDPRKVSELVVEDGNFHRNERILRSPREVVSKEINVDHVTLEDLSGQLELVDEDINYPKKPILHIRVTGSDMSVKPSNFRQHLDKDDFFEIRISDEREVDVSDSSDVSIDESVEIIDEKVDSVMSETEIGDKTSKIDEIVRNENVKDSEVRDKVNKVINDES